MSLRRKPEFFFYFPPSVRRTRFIFIFRIDFMTETITKRVRDAPTSRHGHTQKVTRKIIR